MIYDFPNPQAPIRQGDIFRQIPHIEFDPARLLVVADLLKRQAEVLDWLQIAVRTERTPALVTLRPVYAIVITQDCDAARLIKPSLKNIVAANRNRSGLTPGKSRFDSRTAVR